MMDFADRLQLAVDVGEPPDFGAFRRYQLRPGKVMVAMVCVRERVGALLLTDEEAGRTRPDVGWVVGVGAGVSLAVGDLVVVDPYAGKWIEGCCGWGLVRFFGDESVDGVVTIPPWWDQVVAVMETGERIRPTGTNVLIGIRPVDVVSEGGILIPDFARQREGTARVLEVGSLVTEVAVGDEVVYHMGGLQKVEYGRDVARAYGIDEGDLGLLDQENIYCVIAEEEGSEVETARN